MRTIPAYEELIIEMKIKIKRIEQNLENMKESLAAYQDIVNSESTHPKE